MRTLVSSFGIGVLVVIALATNEGCTAERPEVADPGGSSLITLTGACGTDGATRACHINLGERDGVIDCFAGAQECRGGEWSACGGTDVTLMSTQVAFLASQAAPAGGDLAPRTLGAPSAVGSCTGDPCNPYCRESAEATPAQATGSTTVAYTYSSNPWGNAPGGFVGKQDCSPACGTGFPKGCNGSPTHYNKFDACQAEHHCDTASGSCVRNQSPTDWTWPLATCPGIDLTVGPACAAGGVEGFNICNRGNTAMAVAQGPINVFIDTGNAYDFGATTCATHAGSCSIALTAALAPGACRRVIESECAAWGSGNKIAYVNSDRSVPECGGNTSGTAATMPGCNNNWSDIKKGGSACSDATTGGYTVKTMTQTLTASCAFGTQVSWNKLVYNVTAPVGTSVTFAAQVTDTLIDGGVGPTLPSAGSFTTLLTETTTKNCSMSGPSGCPYDLYAGLGGFPAATYETITIKTTLTPDPAGLTTPTLNSWAITYNCTPSE